MQSKRHRCSLATTAMLVCALASFAVATNCFEFLRSAERDEFGGAAINPITATLIASRSGNAAATRRKISSFMPMRGKKSHALRELPSGVGQGVSDAEASVNRFNNNILVVEPDDDDDGDALLAQLLATAAAVAVEREQQMQQLELQRPPSQPPAFVEQLRRQAWLARRNINTSNNNNNNNGVDEQGGNASNGDLDVEMDAKRRRSPFMPMRGKRIVLTAQQHQLQQQSGERLF